MIALVTKKPMGGMLEVPVGPVAPESVGQVLSLLWRAHTRVMLARSLEGFPGLWRVVGLDHVLLVAECLLCESGLDQQVDADTFRHDLAMLDAPFEGSLKAKPEFALQALAAGAVHDLLALKDSVDTLQELGEVAARPLEEIVGALR